MVWTYSSHVFLVTSGSALKPPSSVHVAERPVPNSRRPPERMSRTAARSATRIGWLNCGTHTTMPWPTRMFWVCMAQAVKNSSGAEECEYSSRKWCSTHHTEWKPSSSASRTCSSALNTPNFTARLPDDDGRRWTLRRGHSRRRSRWASDRAAGSFVAAADEGLRSNGMASGGTVIGFVGTGTMGAPMAGHLVAAGYDVRVHDRSAFAMDAVDGATAVATAA